jgi:[amino group carrier protein]-L-2-aminoadipate 6-kinase
MLLIKIGGSKKFDWENIAKDLKELNTPYILVHGANEYMKEICKRMGETEKIIISPSGYESRYSDSKTMDIFLQAYSGLANKRIVEVLRRNGIDAIGLSGVDGGLWKATKKEKIIGRFLEEPGSKNKVIRDNYVGKVDHVNVKLIRLLLDNNFVPVITAPAISSEGEIVNVDNDRAVAVMVRELSIKDMIMLFEAPGLLRDLDDISSLVKNISIKNFDEMLKYAKARMKKKVLGAKEAFDNGLERMYWGDGRIKSPVSNCLQGKGTIISR